MTPIDPDTMLILAPMIGLFYLGKPMYALVWLFVTALLPDDNIGMAAFVLFLILIMQKFRKVATI